MSSSSSSPSKKLNKFPPVCDESLPPSMIQANQTTKPLTTKPEGSTPDNSGTDSDDEYMPKLPPKIKQTNKIQQIGPSLPPTYFKQINREHDSISTHKISKDYNDDDESITGPLPLPDIFKVSEENEGVEMFRENERRKIEREQEEAEKGLIKRDEWMLLPPKELSLAASIDPTKLRSRGFKQTSKPHSSESGERNQQVGSLWTESPMERQERLKDESLGKRKRAENGSNSRDGDEMFDKDSFRDHKRDQYMKEQVESYNKSTRNKSLLDLHKQAARNVRDSSSSSDKRLEKSNEVIWDHESMIGSNGGKLIGDKQRDQIFKEAKGLGGRFGKGSFI
ncbi:hypothetical protein BY996DRAFT_7225359 [Phakopsora pachyrhizi]|uniref:DUF3752 domain-containing protein n=1 Tax=Phakopsora pachyrhizi TaxID=170000 RepID=A0AAV0BPP3_PHAPC|nr:hypothetical protein BY996DRAFT_7225359 [Phakopsora pachyrhizi]CAH7689142.1 hypothetical protein PPACK8108_LOCUS24215 [Phakopsora pachyrhizi]CAH7689315.1 hypothetical protein PPACK8108_LOCUS24368 [Phakopsora pachyrhizi]